MDVELDAGLYGPGSEAWRLNREAMLLLGAGPRALLLQLPVDLVHEQEPLAAVERLRLLDHQPVDLFRAIAGEVALRAAAEILEVHRVGIVDGGAGEVQRDLEIEPRHLRVPHAGLDLLEHGLDPDLAELVHHPARGVDVDRERAGGDRELHRVRRSVPGVGEQLLRVLFLLRRVAHARQLRDVGAR